MKDETLDNEDDSGLDKKQWRSSTHIELDETGKGTIRFENIALPRLSDKSEILFSAYAFNSDRVKTSTATYKFKPARVTTRPSRTQAGERRARVAQASSTRPGRRAYVITIGVNAFENNDWDLKYAANDAHLMGEVLLKGLMQSARYAEVVLVPLISDYKEVGGSPIPDNMSATKANFKAALALLAGKAIDQAQAIPEFAKLKKSGPDDMVIISFSSHGYTDKNGAFYLLPYDIGEGQGREITKELSDKSISSRELTLWLRDVDADEILMIVDACHSAATVAREGFVPGPMGSPGLGRASI